MEMSEEIMKILDLRGLKCPLPVLKTRKAMKHLAPGARILVETTDPLAGIDIPAFCNEYGHSLLEVQDHEGHQGFLIEKETSGPL